MSIVLNGNVLTAIKSGECAEITAVDKSLAGLTATEEVAATFGRVVTMCHLNEGLSVGSHKYHLGAVFCYVDAKTGELRTKFVHNGKLIGCVYDGMEQRHRQTDY